jgi:hypothetical protein
MESTIETFIQENSFPEYRDIPAPVYRLLTITDSHDHDHGHDAETVKKMMKENTKAKEVSVSMSLTLTLTLLIDFPEKQHIGPEKMGWLFGEFPAVPISSWERRGPDEGETRHASLARLEIFRGVLRAEGKGRVVFGPEWVGLFFLSFFLLVGVMGRMNLDPGRYSILGFSLKIQFLV